MPMARARCLADFGTARRGERSPPCRRRALKLRGVSARDVSIEGPARARWRPRGAAERYATCRDGARGVAVGDFRRGPSSSPSWSLSIFPRAADARFAPRELVVLVYLYSTRLNDCRCCGVQGGHGPLYHGQLARHRSFVQLWWLAACRSRALAAAAAVDAAGCRAAAR